MNIQKLKINDIKPAKYNPRLDLQPGDPDYEKLKKSLEEFGLGKCIPLIFSFVLRANRGHWGVAKT
ncbi:MAG: hypothetical protein KJ674_01635 [Nanoarchaeota archaeon]|nr:hypothetical protein [Nanoarchaeota archaeon]